MNTIIIKTETFEINDYNTYEKLFVNYANKLLQVNLGNELCDVYSGVLQDLEYNYPNFYQKLERRLEKIF